ncbi:hypothetical protein FQN60_004932 [Etheostoma spectabile]|uniref:Uncharacterized protein n=1 Tax=Etheostoma spectabile TaxID=54343 RepID=A0A5J5DLJ3_9PERO|nr:hypothetical protein FQN60_004932 [Etheostoma spectabile]
MSHRANAHTLPASHSDSEEVSCDVDVRGVGAGVSGGQVEMDLTNDGSSKRRLKRVPHESGSGTAALSGDKGSRERLESRSRLLSSVSHSSGPHVKQTVAAQWAGCVFAWTDLPPAHKPAPPPPKKKNRSNSRTFEQRRWWREGEVMCSPPYTTTAEEYMSKAANDKLTAGLDELLLYHPLLNSRQAICKKIIVLFIVHNGLICGSAQSKTGYAAKASTSALLGVCRFEMDPNRAKQTPSIQKADVVHLDKEEEMQKLPLQPPYYDMAPSESTPFTDNPNSGHRDCDVQYAELDTAALASSPSPRSSAHTGPGDLVDSEAAVFSDLSALDAGEAEWDSGRLPEELLNPAEYMGYQRVCNMEHFPESQPAPAYPPVTFLPQHAYTQQAPNEPTYSNTSFPATDPRAPFTFPKEQSSLRRQDADRPREHTAGVGGEEEEAMQGVTSGAKNETLRQMIISCVMGSQIFDVAKPPSH